METNNEYALVTGSSYGFGAEMATILAEKGFNIILTGRSTEKLSELQKDLKEKYKIEAHSIPLDLSKEDGAKTLYDEVQKLNVPVSVLINNAGFGQQGKFVDLEPQRDRNMMMLNMVALTEVTKLFLPSMLEKKRGWIMNVASTGAFQPGPYMSTYFATKAYVNSLSQALTQELKGTGVSVTSLCPGPTNTNFIKDSDLGSSGIGSGIFLHKSPQKVARQGVAALFSGKRVIITGFVNKFLYFLGKVIPRKIELIITAHFLK